VETLFQQYEGIRSSLREELPDLFGDLPDEPLLRDKDVVLLDEYGIFTPVIRRELFDRMVGEIDYCAQVAASHDSAPEPELRREGIFFAGQQYDAFRFVSNLVSSAKSSIFVIDAYADDKVVEVLAMKAAGVEVRILAQQPTKPSLKPAAESFNKQHGGLCVRLSSKFHDRFLILDDSEFYHLGASFNRLGERAFMFSRIEEPLVIDALKAAVAQEWAKATVAISAPASSGAP